MAGGGTAGILGVTMHLLCSCTLRTVPLCHPAPSLKYYSPVSSSLLVLISSPNYLIRITDSAKQEHELQENKKNPIQYKTSPPKLVVRRTEQKCFVPRLDPSGFRLFESINLRHGRDRQLESGANSYCNYSVPWPSLVHWMITHHEGETRAALNQGSGNQVLMFPFSLSLSFFLLLWRV